jgi:hypothetical protein
MSRLGVVAALRVASDLDPRRRSGKKPRPPQPTTAQP